MNSSVRDPGSLVLLKSRNAEVVCPKPEPTVLLMLPLVGGVTLGVERTSSAAQRAWMSLMGPLPGIVLGWVLYGCIFFLAPPQPWPWLYSLARIT